MSLTEGAGGLSVADVAALNGGLGNGNGFFGADGAWWLIILLLFANIYNHYFQINTSWKKEY